MGKFLPRGITDGAGLPMLTQDQLKKTSLFEEHLKLKAKMVPFGGWEMPVQYEGILAEYEHTRRGCALFDTSHMGEFLIKGDVLRSGLDRIVTMPIVDMPLNVSRYGFILNDQGGTIDDLIVFRVKEDEWFIVVNGGTTEKDALHFKKYLTKNASFEDISLKTGKLDLQGPLSRDILAQFNPEVKRLGYFTFDYFDILGEKVLVSRTGYTGELGYEIFFPWEKIKELWKSLLKDGRVKPAGLGARDVLRLEMGYSLYGHELTDNISPLEAGLSRFIDFNKDFRAKEILVKQREGLKRKLVGFTSLNRRSPRAEQKIYSASNEEIGVVTSGSFSPALNKGIGLGFVRKDLAVVGEKIFIGEGKSLEAVVSGRIFFKGGSLRTKN